MADPADATKATQKRAAAFVLTLRAEPSPIPAAVRLRAVLKRLLRTYNFRCTDIRAEPRTDVSINLDVSESLKPPAEPAKDFRCPK